MSDTDKYVPMRVPAAEGKLSAATNRVTPEQLRAAQSKVKASRTPAPVTPAEGEAEEWARFIENAHEEWCEENENRDPFHFDSWRAVARAVLARRSPVETEENWEYGVKWGDGDSTNLCGTLERAQNRASAEFGDVIVRRLKRREVPAGPWLPVTEEKKP